MKYMKVKKQKMDHLNGYSLQKDLKDINWLFLINLVLKVKNPFLLR
jgi:hypothetical protein